MLEFANGFGIFPTRDQAEECARDYKGAYTVVRVEINHAIHRGDQCPACAIGSARRSPGGGLRCSNCGWTGAPASDQS
jgi:ribosomal protein L37AE/L43A